MIQLQEIHNPVAVGFRWTSDDAEHELCWTRGQTGFVFGFRATGNRNWSTTRVDNPRFTPSTLQEAREMAKAFVNGEGY